MEFRRGYTADVGVRAKTVLELCEKGMNHVQIAARYGISRERVRQLHGIGLQLRDMGELSTPDCELPIRIYNALVRDGFEQITPEAVRERYLTIAQLRRVPGFGDIAIAELQMWLVKHGQKLIP
jgi:hypothetical protein